MEEKAGRGACVLRVRRVHGRSQAGGGVPVPGSVPVPR